MNPEPPPIAAPHSTAPRTIRAVRTGKTVAAALTYWFFGLLVLVADLLLADAVIEALVKSGLQQGLMPRFIPATLCTLAIVVLSSVAFLLIRRGIRIWKQGQ